MNLQEALRDPSAAMPVPQYSLGRKIRLRPGHRMKYAERQNEYQKAAEQGSIFGTEQAWLDLPGSLGVQKLGAALQKELTPSTLLTALLCTWFS
jgi:hypothetical protein